MKTLVSVTARFALIASGLAPLAACVGVPAVGVSAPAVTGTREPIVCGGTDVITLDEPVIRSSGPSVIARDRCAVTLSNCRLASTGDFAVRNEGSGDVALEHCHVEGAKGSVHVSGAGSVYALHSTLFGRIVNTSSEGGSFVPQGGTTVR